MGQSMCPSITMSPRMWRHWYSVRRISSSRCRAKGWTQVKVSSSSTFISFQGISLIQTRGRPGRSSFRSRHRSAVRACSGEAAISAHSALKERRISRSFPEKTISSAVAGASMCSGSCSMVIVLSLGGRSGNPGRAAGGRHSGSAIVSKKVRTFSGRAPRPNSHWATRPPSR